MNLSRRDFVKFLGACVLVGAGAVAWDAGVNEGRPVEEPADEEPP